MAFIRRMRGRQYGLTECQDAFQWFVRGWIDANLLTLADKLSQVNSEQHASEEVPHDINMPVGKALNTFF